MAQLLQREPGLLTARVQHPLPIGLGNALGRTLYPGTARSIAALGSVGHPARRGAVEGRPLGS